MKGEIDDYKRLSVFRSKYSADSNLYVLLDQEDGKREIMALKSTYGPSIKIKPIDGKFNLDFENKYKIRIQGFSSQEPKEIEFRVFGKKYDFDFSAEKKEKEKQLRLSNLEYSVNDLYKLSGKYLAFGYSPYDPSAAEVVDIIQGYTPESEKNEERQITNLKHLARHQNLFVGLFEQKKDGRLMVFQDDKLLFEIPETRQFLLFRYISIYKDEKTGNIIIAYSYLLKPNELYLTIKKFDS